jgi:histidinol-phosphate aminotransferase
VTSQDHADTAVDVHDDHPTPRPGVAAMPAYVAGKPPAEHPGMTTYKLSSNENPYPPLPGVVEAAVAATARMNRYPDAGNADLVAALARTYGVPAEHLALGTGAVALIYQLVAAYAGPGDEVVFAWRSFEAYPIAVLAAGASYVQVPLLADARHDLDAMAAAVTDRTRIVIVCSPNNPTGPSVTRTELDAFLAKIPPSVLVILDEAYTEFVRMDDAVDGVDVYRDHPNVAVLRTFSKAYGLAGFRVGYVLATTPIAAVVRAVTLPFGVNLVAQAAAVESLDRRSELFERVDALVAERERVLDGVRAAGWPIPDAQGNFIWFDLRGDQSAIDAFTAAAADRGIVVRPLGDGIRVTIGETEANDRLIALAGDVAPPS